MRSNSRAAKKMRLIPLIAATFFMVSGGPYAIEDILGSAGFLWALALLVLIPVVWSLPTALMIGELASAIPADGGFYVWVRRALGPFWGYQEAWLSLTASIFDMAIYPAFAVSYLGKFDAGFASGWHGYVLSLGIVALCCVWNLWGAPAVGEGSVVFSVLLLSPFVVFVGLGVWHGLHGHASVHWGAPAGESTISTAILVALWNYMGWDNASTVAQEVDRPQRSYPLAMLGSTALVTITYVLPLAGAALAGISLDRFRTGDWSLAAADLGGPVLGMAVAAGGVLTGIGMFNALVLSYSRVPMAMAEDGLLPRVLVRRNRREVPWVSVLLCGVAWALALRLPFEKLITIDLVLYGTSLLLEFVALIVLRVREPQLKRPFKAGNLAFASALAVGPTALIGYALYASHTETVMLGGKPISALAFSICIALVGPVLYGIFAPWRRKAMAAAD